MEVGNIFLLFSKFNDHIFLLNNDLFFIFNLFFIENHQIFLLLELNCIFLFVGRIMIIFGFCSVFLRILISLEFLYFSVYTNLGEDAVVHALNETGVRVVVTSHELLPKFRLVCVTFRTVI